MIRAVAYCRYSTDLQTENSIAYQLQNINKLCDEKGMVLVDCYADEARSGSNTNRESLQRLLNDIPTDKFDAVVIDDQSRLSRSVVDWFTLRELLQANRKTLYSCAEKLEDYDENPAAFLSEGIKAIFNQQYLIDTRRKVISGITVRAKDGKFCGGLPPLGYDIVDGQYFINEKEAAGVHEIFELYASGKSYSDLVDYLADHGILSKRGKPIGNNAIYQILRNERYIGTFTWNKRMVKRFGKWAGGVDNPNMVVIEGIIPVIIEEELWERVQRRMDANKHNTMNKSRCKREYLLSGLLRCAKCGGSFVGSTTTNKKGSEYKFYSCATKKRLHTCDAKNIAANDIEPLVMSIVKGEILNDEMIDRVADLVLASASNTKGDQESITRKELDAVNKKIENVMKAIDSGIVSPSVMEHLSELEKEKRALDIKVSQFRPNVTVTREQLIKKLKADAKALWESEDTATKREILREYIVRIDIGDEEITINAVNDLAEKDQTAGNESDGLNTSGCGGAQQAVFKIIADRHTGIYRIVSAG